MPRHGKSISGLLSVVPVTTGTHPQRLPPDQRRRTKPPPPSFRTVAAGLNPPPRSLPSVQRRHTKPTLPRAPTREIHLRPTLRRSRDDGNPSPAVAARPTPPHEATPAVIPDCSGGFETRLPGHCRQSNAATRSHPCLVPRHGKSISGLLSVVPVTTGTHPQRLPPDQHGHTKPPLPRPDTKPPRRRHSGLIPPCSGGFETRLPGHCRQSNAATRSHPCLVPISQPNAGPSRLATVRSSQAPALSGMRRRPVPMPGQGLLSPHRLGQVVRRQVPCCSRRRRSLGRG